MRIKVIRTDLGISLYRQSDPSDSGGVLIGNLTLEGGCRILNLQDIQNIDDLEIGRALKEAYVLLFRDSVSREQLNLFESESDVHRV